ncbi:MAG: hypothetical protein GWN01_00330, partial [Nitrosopumilaceae archaeon]|nr:hypothetical protein [Nitrosopumilaceae archaeon]NIV64644.1 hypothetical protein [Nitrosopumilaceae archaeon]NIX60033.1 hypothetical protein [Nitrosopumilaceae archaeon]
MKIKIDKFVYILTFLIFYIFLILQSQAQDSQDTQVRKLPQIKLEDYTIIGLEKVVLPSKERRTIAKKISPDWSENSFVRLKE